MTNYKRQWRELSPEHKEKISQAAGLHKPKSTEHKEHISQALKNYWSNVPHKPQDGVSMDEFLNGSSK